jgi:Na+/H+-dicarboxylate symporter
MISWLWLILAFYIGVFLGSLLPNDQDIKYVEEEIDNFPDF